MLFKENGQKKNLLCYFYYVILSRLLFAFTIEVHNKSPIDKI